MALRAFLNDFANIDQYLEELFSVFLHVDYTVTPCMPDCPDYQNYGCAFPF